MTPGERQRVSAMYGSILGLHLIGFTIFVAFVIPAHYRGLGIGVSVLAYTLGLRHAFDADHIAVIDNITRKELSARHGTGKPRPLCFGYFFSLGHSTVVVVVGVAIVVAEKAVFGQLVNGNSGLERFGTLLGTVISAVFLFLIGSLNLVILHGIGKVFRAMRRGEYDEAELERQLDNRGLLFRFFGRWARAISKEWQLYPVGVLFGLGFDTATEVLLLGTTAFLALQHIPWYAICCLPVLFTAGMSVLDTTDGIVMNVAYGWAFFNPVRKVYYNLAITGLSVLVCFVVGGIETLGLISSQVRGLRQATGFWRFLHDFNLNVAGFVIVGLFLATWAAALLIWRYGHIEERWRQRWSSTDSRPEASPGPDFS
jgi:high-affinity nickel-transport protein